MNANVEQLLSAARAGKPVVMGILNVTPDSFSDGGRFTAPDLAVAQARAMLADGADIIDIGAESTRPGSQRIGPAEQIERLRDVLPAVAAAGAVVSVDTTLAKVARFALDAGAVMLNDVSAGRDDPEMFTLAAERDVTIVLMHMLGEPKTMQVDPHYDDVVAEVCGFLAKRIASAVEAGVRRERIIVDPGIGFGKHIEHNLELMNKLGLLASLKCPILVGPSRKRFIGELTGQDCPDDRIAGTLAACLACRQRGASLFRVHDVRPLRDALAVCQAIDEARGKDSAG